MNEIEQLKSDLDSMTRRVIMLEQYISAATRTEPSGTTTVGALTNISDEQLGDNPLLYVEHADGGLNVYLSQIVAQAQKNIDAGSITSGTLDADRLPDIPAAKIPAAVNSADAGTGFGGFRYTVSDVEADLFTS